MNASDVEKVTELILKELNSQHNVSREPEKPTGSMVKFHKNLNTIPDFKRTPDLKEKKVRNHMEDFSSVDHPTNQEYLTEQIKKTPARIGVGRAGVRPKTNALLKFRLDHAAAVDSVYGKVSDELLNRMNWFSVQTMVEDQEVYIRRPDLGRKLNDEAKKQIAAKCKKNPEVQIVISDGLSFEAVEKNAEDVFLSLQQALTQLGYEQGTPFFVKNGRVAIMDDIGEALNPEVVVLLIGERPGLISAESLSAYLCYKPRKGTIEADRMVISNIHAGGIPPAEAGAYLGNVVKKILDNKASGISLVKREK
ncbi:ethanolamine ammonia-lyase subunit EutC [Fictibacillus fluitans]|uniref:Ethanolamine ammonia-lyase small subunit n=1 Tax=Fictibacillus fluitans TaxID=3058422 RepID=A0ABT8I0T4_9BACL|nr:ethanolamine ammonia-lyase subunit EutC [Fictibacillus sp. NE201]MDN4526635.1 ethanolamine ammonia-lyase subunit EutC [Fictibacillus sp. NE201]